MSHKDMGNKAIVYSSFVFMAAMVVLVISISSVWTPYMSDEQSSRTFTFDNEDITVQFDEIIEYSTISRPWNQMLTAYQYVTPEDPVVLAVYDALEPSLSSMDDTEKAESLMKFVYYNTRYTDDDGNYSQFPSETLRTGRGDCEDMAFLLYTLYDIAGLDTVFLDFKNHLAVGVAVDVEGESYTTWLSDTQYKLADPTWNMFGGEHPLDLLLVYKPTKVIVYEMLMVILLVLIFVTVEGRDVMRSSNKTRVQTYYTQIRRIRDDNL